MHEIDLSLAMKDGMRRLASGVAVLACHSADNVRHAMTVSSITSVSDSPASLLVCVHEQTAMHALLEKPGDAFVINILAANQQDVSNLCAGRDQGECRFSLGDWQQGFDKQPYLADAQAVFFCRLDKITNYGTHKIVIGQIAHVMINESAVDPLIYVDGDYAGFHKLS